MSVEIKPLTFPKGDFKQVIDNDKAYLQALKNVIQAGALKLNKYVKDGREADYSCAKLQIEMLDFLAKMKVQENIIQDKEQHYFNIFLPKYEQELKETADNFDAEMALVNTILESDKSSLEGKSLKIYQAIEHEMEKYNEYKKVYENEIEYKRHMYFMFRRLRVAYETENTAVSGEAIISKK
jgi:hypothetical protein